MALTPSQFGMVTFRTSESVGPLEPGPAPPAVLPSTPVGTSPVLKLPTFWAFMVGEWRNISPWVQSARWQHGSPQARDLGAVMSSAFGSLQLENIDGFWSPWSPADWVNPRPGVFVEIWTGSTRGAGEALFVGRSLGVLEQTPLTGHNVATMNLVGPLHWINAFNDRLFLSLPAETSGSEAFAAVLGDVNYTGPRRIYESDVRLQGRLLNNSNKFKQGQDRRASTNQAFRFLAELEMSRTYDSRVGEMVYESWAKGPRRLPLPTARDLNTANFSVQHVVTGNVLENVINEIQVIRDNFVSQGHNDVATLPPTPTTITIPARSNGALAYFAINETVEDRTEFIQSWTQPVLGTTYTTTHPVTITLRPAGALAVFVDVQLVGGAQDDDATVTLLSLNANGFRKTSEIDRSVRASNPLSFKVFGTREATYPMNVVDGRDWDRQEARLQTIVDLRDGLRDSIRTCRVVLSDAGSLAAFNVSDLVSFDWVLNDRTIIEDGQFWVDQVAHEINHRGDWTVTLELSDYRLTLAL